MIDSSGSLPEQASELLPVLAKESLQSMGRAWGLDVKNQTKSDLVDMLDPWLTDPERIDRGVRSLAPRERAALELVILNGGRLSAHALRGQLRAQGLIDPEPEHNPYVFSYDRREGSPSRVDSPRFEDILARLGALGLAFPWPPPGDGSMLTIKRHATLVIVPPPILRLLPPVTLTVSSVREPGLTRAGSSDAVLRDLVSVLSAIRREPIQLTARGLIPKRTLVKLGSVLSLPETELGYATFLTSLAIDAGLIVEAGGRLQEGSQTERFLQLSRGERLRELYEAYAGTAQWSELMRIPRITIRGTVQGSSVARGRGRVLDILGRVPPGRWVEIDHVVDIVRRAAYEFLIPRVRNDPYGYYRDYPFNPYKDGNALGVSFDGVREESDGWNRIEGTFIRVMLVEPLFWLGLVDLGFAESDTDPNTFLLNEVGTTLLQGRVPELPQPSANVVVQPNFQLFAFEPTAEDVLFGLERLADRVSAQQAIEYRISRDSIYRAQQSGMEVEEILAFLDGVSTVPIPQNVSRSIEEWAAQNDRVVVRRGASLLQTIDAATLDALYARGDIAPLLGRRLAPTAALVPYANLVAVNTRLSEGAGPMPALSEGNDAQLGAAVSVGDDGTIAFRERLPSIFVRREVQRVAELDGDGAYRLTRASLRRAARQLGPDDIIQLLSYLQGTPLSERVADVVRRWTEDWGSAALAEVLLLQVDRSDILEALLEAPDLRPYLQRLEGASTSALVQPKHLDAVRAALEDRGMELRTTPATVRTGRSSKA